MRDFHQPGRSAVYADNGMVATSHPLAAQAALDILKKGGNAMDAAIAGAILLGICEPQMTGIGGDCFALWSPAGSDEIHAMNGSGRAPAGSDADALRGEGHSTMPLNDARSVTIPTAIDAFCRLSEEQGKLGLEAILAPAIQYADSGVRVAPRVAFDWPNCADVLQGDALRHFLPAGTPPKPGTLFRAPGQAEVLRRIAASGRDAFYTGEVAEDMVSALRQLGGAHTLDDFAAARADYSDPISSHYGGIELVEHAPNGQGATAMLILNILAQFDIAAMEPFGPERAHIEAEATKLGYDARNRFLADFDYVTRLEHMLSMDTAKKLAAQIDPKRAMAQASTVSEAIHKETIYITVVDQDRMAVSLIYSIFHGFGSGIASDRFGILFQNRGAGFSLEHGHPNELAPGKRPMHTIIPGMTRRNGAVEMAFGVMGGAYQANGHARVLTNMEDFGMYPQAALDAPRSFPDAGILTVERGYSDATRAALSEMGHHVEIPQTPIGGAQAIRLDTDGYLEGASDPRKDGCALGY
ncbi:gamma-glutamyltransferase 2. Threonine peptidase. MEROPS family T03 [Poseidonocella pacifica]|uniref:Gamma-glutamyltransferase 2. Threonine peptidase. MEROPS family T03 n=1 Tax=Poseidonocella pacifica TaxID=871651 RepID=A0A1I0XNC3_9RHOB|nr:gamma-glutamyltransferase family protein [Poseidonocella pacifica]SFB01678.1 gamma-glutamyltransferase 2. Threonine peptidase. MEROPS family T03 [Poseidonocella pacifica]